jgi:hypothetical protein
MPVEVPVPLMAVAFPIVPGKTAEWHTFIGELNGPRHKEFADARRRAGVRERTYLQATPMGDLVIVTLEGDDPARSFGQLMAAKDEFTTWFLERVKAIHGVDLTAPMTEAPSRLVVDSTKVAVPAA